LNEDCSGSPAAPSKAEARRQRIMQAARGLFIVNGFHATGMAQIAKCSGVAIGQIYRDYASKEEIVVALVSADCARLMRYEVLAAAIRDGDAEGVSAWLRDFVEPSDDPDDARLFAEILAESTRSPRIAAIFCEVQDELRRHLDDALKLLAPAHAAAPRRSILAEVITTLSVGMTHQQLMRPEADLSGVVDAVHAVLDRELRDLAKGCAPSPDRTGAPH
jgi:AcrR family transcriptional regulator